MVATYASAGGSAVVGDKVTYKPEGAVVASPGAGQTTMVYIPVTNPPTQSDKLTSIAVECTGTDAKAVELWAYFGRKLIYDGTVPAPGNDDFTLSATSSSQLADDKPYGIDVAIQLYFTTASATFEINSVTLQFGTGS